MKQIFILLMFISVSVSLSGVIDLNKLFNYEDQDIPVYILRDNSLPLNQVQDLGATLGRVLFYDTKLSIDNTVSCSSCHIQSHAFSDTAIASKGVNGETGRHSMRLINSSYSDEFRFFWDERVASLEHQTTKPIRDHIEMGFSGDNGDPGIDSLFRKIEAIPYYNILFRNVFGDTEVSESRLQNSMGQFIRSIVSFDSPYDEGLARATNPNQRFFNATQQEQMGKMLFTNPPQFDSDGNRVGGGLGCAGCHQPPEFSIVRNSRNNGIIDGLDGQEDLNNTRSPSLRDLFNPNGEANSAFMHNGFSSDIYDVLDHYNDVKVDNANLDGRLKPNGNPQKLNMTQEVKDALVAFLKTLSGTDVYTNEKWSDPFTNGELEVVDIATSLDIEDLKIRLYPNPSNDFIHLDLLVNHSHRFIKIYDLSANLVLKTAIKNRIDITQLIPGTYYLQVGNYTTKFIKK